MKKRIVATLVSLCLLVGLFPATALAVNTYIDANADKGPLQGEGTAEKPYLISSAEDLESIRYYVKETGFDNTYKAGVPQKYESVVIDGYFKLTADIDLAGSTWVPIGWTEENKDFYAKTAFVGTFDGDHHTIKNLALGNYTSAEGEPTQYFGNGLFTRANGATIKNFTIDGVTTPDGNIGAYASAVVGVLGKGTFENITVKNAEVTVANNFGFIFADSWQYSAKDANDFVVVKNCTVEDSKIHSSAGTVGFIFGRNMNNNADVPLINDIQNCTVKNCEVDAAGGYVGGLFGSLRSGQVKDCKVENVTVTQNCAEVKTQTNYAGVFAAAITGCTVKNCAASGSVTSNTRNTGGFAGNITAQGSTAGNIINCVADAEVEGKSYVGGFVGSASGTFKNCHAKGNVTATQTSTGTDTDQQLKAGGFVGDLSGGTLTGCTATGNVTADESVALPSGKNARNSRGVGGLVGNAYFKATETIIDCYATGNVSSKLYVGGLVGLPGDSSCLTVKNSYFCGTVTAQDLYGVYYGKHTTGNTYYRPKQTEGFGYTNGGLFPNGVSHEDGKLATPEKAGYTFGGWYDNEGLTGDATETYVNDTAYYAKWVSTITFDANSGTLMDSTPISVEEGKAISTVSESYSLPTPTRAGYTFQGWYTAQTGGNKVETSTVPTGNTTLYAQWKPNTYTIKFNSNGGSGTTGTNNELLATYDTLATLPANGFTMANKNFAGWDTTEGVTTATYADGATVENLAESGTVTLYAVWTDKQVLTPDKSVQTKTYNGAAQAFTLDRYTISYKQNGEAVTAPINAGTYDVVISAAETDTTAAYPETLIPGGLVIEKATLTVTADNKTMYVNGTLPTYTYTVTGWKGSDSRFTTEPTVTCSADGKTAGTYTITASGANAGDNYIISYVDGTLTVYVYSSGDSDSGSSTPTYTVTAPSNMENGSVSVSPKNAKKGDTVTITVKPDKGYELDALIVTDKNGNEIRIKSKGDDKYTFTMPAGKVTIQAAFVEISHSWTNPYTDVSSQDWFYTAVSYVNEKGIMSGMTTIAFGPTTELSRAMIAQMLYNYDSSAQAGLSGSYTDVDSGAWYKDAVNWAAYWGIVSGYGEGKFGPETPITREQLATILYNYARIKGYDTAAHGSLAVFSDGDTVSNYAAEPMRWAVAHGLFSGNGNGVLSPTATATRAEVASILMNFCETVVE